MANPGVVAHAFTSGQVARLVGCHYQTIVGYLGARSGREPIVAPSIRAAAGPGAPGRRLWSFADIVALKILRELRLAGVSMPAIRKVIRELADAEGADFADARTLARYRLFVDPADRDVLVVRDKRTLESLLHRPGQYRLPVVLDLGALHEHIRHEAEELLAAA